LLASFGATAAAAKLLRLSERQILDAFSLTLCQATCSGEIIHSPNSLLRAVRDAFPARAGVTSALLARQAVTGFDAPLEGRAGFFATFARGKYRPEAILEDLGSRFEIENIAFKPWPSCRGTHAAIDAALSCRHEFAIDAENIEQITVRGGPLLRMLSEPARSKQAPATAIDAKFSVPFTTATALVHGRVGLQDFQPAALSDARVLALAKKVTVDANFPSAGPVGARLEIRLRNGQPYEKSIATPLGSPANPLTREKLLGKFDECASHAAHPLAADSARRFAHSVLGMESIGNIAQLAAELR
jgi:2-methylcitrate dehydratase PrpD